MLGSAFWRGSYRRFRFRGFFFHICFSVIFRCQCPTSI